MAVDPEKLDAIARETVDLYRAAEAAVLEQVTRRLAAGLDAPDWAVRRLGALSTLRTSIERILTIVQRAGAVAIRAALAAAYRAGSASALFGISARLLPRDPDTVRAPAVLGEVPRAAVLQNLAAALIEDIGQRCQNVLRDVLDTYRQVIAQATAASVAGGITRREASQMAFARFVDRGLTSFRDRAGRRWRLTSYVEMAVRTVTARAAVQGQTDRQQAIGLDLVVISNAAQECERCRPFEGRVLRIGPGPTGTVQVPHQITGAPVAVDIRSTLEAARVAGLFHPNCFPGDVLVSAPSGVRAADARRYEGELVVIHTASGDELSVTPNHPVLTPEGWVAAGAIKVGDRVLRYSSGDERVHGVRPGNEQVPTRIGEVFDSLRKASPMLPVRVPSAPEQFHGDGFDADVEVVFADGLLSGAEDAPFGEGFEDVPFVVRSSRLGALLTDRPSDQVVLCARHASDRGVSSSDLGSPLLGGHVVPLPTLGGAPVGAKAASDENSADSGLRASEPLGDLGLRDAFQVELDGLVDPRGVPLLGDSGGSELPVEGGSVDSDGGRDLCRRLSGLVSADDVVHVERRDFAGHVYNLQTGDGWYVANGIVVHNCRHSARAYLPGVTKLPEQPTADPEGDLARQRQRAIERNIRRWKEREASALTPEAKAGAKARVRKWQSAMRQHLADNPALKRLSYREAIGGGNLPRR
jgi:hypothetical protein